MPAEVQPYIARPCVAAAVSSSTLRRTNLLLFSRHSCTERTVPAKHKRCARARRRVSQWRSRNLVVMLLWLLLAIPCGAAARQGCSFTKYEQKFVRWDMCTQRRLSCIAIDYDACRVEAQEDCVNTAGCTAVAVKKITSDGGGVHRVYVKYTSTDPQCVSAETYEDIHWDLYSSTCTGDAMQPSFKHDATTACNYRRWHGVVCCAIGDAMPCLRGWDSTRWRILKADRFYCQVGLLSAV